MSLYTDGRPTEIDPETGVEYDPEFVAKIQAEIDAIIEDNRVQP